MKLTCDWNLEGTEWSYNTTCARIEVYVPGDVVGILIGILVVAVTSLMVIMGNAIATSYLARVIRRDKKERCSCSKRKYTLTQSDTESKQQLALPGLVNQTNHDFNERDRSLSSPELDAIKKPLNIQVQSETPEPGTDDTPPRKPKRSTSLPHSRKLSGIRLSKKDQEQDTKNEKKRKKDKVLRNNPTSSKLLRNMREINYELHAKTDFKQPEPKTKSNVYEVSSEIYVDDSTQKQEGAAPSSPLDQPKPQTSNARNQPHYYTLEPTNVNDYDSDDVNSKNIEEEEGAEGQIKSFSAQASFIDDGSKGIPMLARSMSDAFQRKGKKPSFRIVSTTDELKKSASGSATWNARMLKKNTDLLQQQRQHQDDEKYGNGSTEAYEDVETSADAVELRPRGVRGNRPLTAAEIDGSYSLLSRSLENGLGGCGQRVELPGYQKLSVGTGRMSSNVM